MKILLVGEMSGTRNGVPWPPRGETVDLPDDEAAALCRGGMAKPVATDTVERAVVDDSDVEQRVLTTESGPVRRGPGRPPKTPVE